MRYKIYLAQKMALILIFYVLMTAQATLLKLLCLVIRELALFILLQIHRRLYLIFRAILFNTIIPKMAQ